MNKEGDHLFLDPNPLRQQKKCRRKRPREKLGQSQLRKKMASPKFLVVLYKSLDANKKDRFDIGLTYIRVYSRWK